MRGGRGGSRDSQDSKRRRDDLLPLPSPPAQAGCQELLVELPAPTHSTCFRCRLRKRGAPRCSGSRTLSWRRETPGRCRVVGGNSRCRTRRVRPQRIQCLLGRCRPRMRLLRRPTGRRCRARWSGWLGDPVLGIGKSPCREQCRRPLRVARMEGFQRFVEGGYVLLRLMKDLLHGDPHHPGAVSFPSRNPDTWLTDMTQGANGVRCGRTRVKNRGPFRAGTCPHYAEGRA